MKAAGGDHSLIEFGLLCEDEEENITQGDAKKRKLNVKEPDPQNQIDQSHHRADITNDASDPKDGQRHEADQQIFVASREQTYMEVYRSSSEELKFNIAKESQSIESPQATPPGQAAMKVDFSLSDTSYLDPERRMASLKPPQRYHKRI